jgi:1,4-dihydroxy-2-naphthoate polyprenyltransferase
VAVCGTYYVQAGTVTATALLAAVPPGLLITAILVVNNLRDIDTDRRAHKRTLAVLLGRQTTLIEYSALLMGAYLIPLILWLGMARSPWMLLPWLTAPLAVRLIRALSQASTGATFNALLAGTARLSLIFSVLLAVGFVLERFF